MSIWGYGLCERKFEIDFFQEYPAVLTILIDTALQPSSKPGRGLPSPKLLKVAWEGNVAVTEVLWLCR